MQDREHSGKNPNDKHMKDWKVFLTNLEPPNRFSWKWRLENVKKKVTSSQSYYRVYNFNNHFTWRPIESQHLHPCSMHVCICIFTLCIRIFTSMICIHTILTVADCTAVSRIQEYGGTTNYVLHQIFRGRNTSK